MRGSFEGEFALCAEITSENGIAEPRADILCGQSPRWGSEGIQHDDAHLDCASQRLCYIKTSSAADSLRSFVVHVTNGAAVEINYLN